MVLRAVVLCLCLYQVNPEDRNKRQINFGGTSSSSSFPSSSSSSSSSGGVSFTGQSNSGGSRRPNFGNNGQSNSGGGGRPNVGSNGTPNFGGSGGQSNFGNSGRPNSGGQSNQGSISSLKGILDTNPPPKETSVNTRFNRRKPKVRYGSFCTTPFGQPGSCRYIIDRQCRPLLNQILSQGVQSALPYIFAAIRSPCGFVGFDFSLCCPDQNQEQTTTTTQRPVQTSTTTTTTSSPSSERCGVGNSRRIVGGTFASAGTWPWAVIVGRPSGSSFQVVCGGTLVNRNTVISAAHCFNGGSDPTHIRAGDTDIRSSADGNGIDVRISAVNKHPSWNPTTLANDIVVLKLSQNLQYSTSVRWACLPFSYQNKDLASIMRNPDPTVVGWGSTAVGGGAETRLKQAQVPMVTQQSCESAYSSVGQVSIGSSKICAGTGGRDTCNGDSGGPLLSDHLEAGWTLVGITSFGVECARPEFPGVYTRVDKFLDWIQPQL
jgi:hypothetical protein